MRQFIIQRYNQETLTKNLGCSNLEPYVNVKPGDTLLDLGCGRGVFTQYLAGLAGSGGKVFGVDLSDKMIGEASKYSATNLEFQVADIHHLAFPDNVFDGVFSNCVINHSTRKDEVYREIYRILKPGGYFLIADVMAVNKLPQEVSTDPLAIASCYGGAILKKDYLDLVAKSGFILVSELQQRSYYKNGFLLESIILRGVKS